KNKDLLVIGAAPQQTLLSQWGSELPAIIDGNERRISEPTRSVNFLYDWLGFDTQPDPSVATQKVMRGTGPLGAMLGFESPLSASRSVVAITGVTDANLADVLD